MVDNDVKALHQQELIQLAHEVVATDFTLVTRSSADESMIEHKVDVMDVFNALRTCNKVTMNFARWPCAEYHGRTHDGEPLIIVGVINQPEKTVKILKVWKG